MKQTESAVRSPRRGTWTRTIRPHTDDRERRPWRRLALALLLCAPWLGCTEKTVQQPRQQGLAPGEERPLGSVTAPVVAPPPPPPPRAAPSTLASPFAPKTPDPGALQRPVPSADEEDAGAVVPTSPLPHDTVAQRDLPAELTALIGRAGECLELATVASSGGRVTIVVTAHAVPSGRITRATADAPGQPASALRCLEQRATAGSLRSPVPGAPLEVTATIPIEVISQPGPR
jgi:hypothetical protein